MRIADDRSFKSRSALVAERKATAGHGVACVCMMLCLILGGCGLLGGGATSAFVSPGKFDYHNCDQLAESEHRLRDREKELTELTERAAEGGASGQFVGAVAYHTELMQTRGQLKQIGEVAERKNCSVQSRWKCDRALF